MHIIGRGRYARETYPGPQSAGVGALRNRNVLAVPQLLVVPFSPGTGAGSLIAATLFTPQVSGGVVDVTAGLLLTNGGVAETYGLSVAIAAGAGLSVSGGAGSSNGWFYGTTVPPTVGGAPTPVQVPGTSAQALAIGAVGSLSVASAISQPLLVGVPVVVEIVLSELGSGHSLASIAITSLSILELP